jgi:hypothetical protein
MDLRSINVIEKRFTLWRPEIDASNCHGYHIRARAFVRFPHHLVAWILSGADEKSRSKSPSRDHQRIYGRTGTAPNEVHNFEFVSLCDKDRLPCVSGNDGTIAFNGDTFPGEAEKVQHLSDIQGGGKHLRFPIEANLNGHGVPDGNTAKCPLLFAAVGARFCH